MSWQAKYLGSGRRRDRDLVVETVLGGDSSKEKR